MAKGGQSPVNVTHHLKGIDFPANRKALIDHAAGNKADKDVMDILQRMPEREYASMADVMKGVGGHRVRAQAVAAQMSLPSMVHRACQRSCVAGAAALMPMSSHAQGAAPDAWLLSLCLTTRTPVAPEDLWQAWSFAPVIVIPLALMLGLYGWAVAKYGPRERGITMTRGPALFVGGWLLLAIALVSPLCRMAATLASAHMVQHVILVALAPPLLVLGAWGLCNQMPGSPAARLPAKTRARPRGNHALRMLSGPAAASTLYAVAIWASHVPLIYQAALEDATAHVVVTYGLVAVSVMFWRAVIDAALNPRTSSGAGGLALLAIFFAMVQTGLLGALLVLSPTPWYPLFAGSVAIWGLTPLEDQQLAGLIMWVPMGAIYLAAGLIVTMIVVFGRRTDVSIALQPAGTLYRRPHQPGIPADRRRSCAAAKLN